MAISRYTQPLDVDIQPIPFEEISRAGLMKQQQYDVNEAMKDQFLDKLYQLPAATPDQPAFQRRLGEIESTVSELVDTTPDLGSEEFRSGIRDVIRAQSRDRFYRDTAANAKREQEYIKKLGDPSITPANKLAIQKNYMEFKRRGTEGYGLLGEPVTSEFYDYRKRLSEEGKGFEEQGTKEIINPDGSITRTFSAEGIDINEVGKTYGYSIKGGVPQFEGIPNWFYGTDEYNQMVRDASYYLHQAGIDRPSSEDLSKTIDSLYIGSTEDLVYKYSGVSTEHGEVAKSDGTSRADREEMYRTTVTSGNTVALPDRPDSIESHFNRVKDLDTQIKEYEDNIATLPEGSVLREQSINLRDAAKRERNKMRVRLENIKKNIGFKKKADKVTIRFIEELFTERDVAGSKISDDVSDDTKKYIKDVVEAGDYSSLQAALGDNEAASYVFNDFDNDGKVTSEDVFNNIRTVYKSVNSLKTAAKRGLGFLKDNLIQLASDTDIDEFLKDRHGIDINESPEEAYEKLDRVWGDAPFAFELVYRKNIKNLDRQLNKKLEEDSKQSGKFNAIIVGEDSKFKPILEDVELAYDKDPNRFQVFETTAGEDGGYVTGDDLPPSLKISELSQTAIPGVGMVYKASYKDEDGDKRTFNVTTNSLPNITNQISNIFEDKATVGDEIDKEALQTAMMLRYPLQLPIVQGLEPNQSYTFYRGLDSGVKATNKPVAKITKKDFKGNKYYVVDVLNPDGTIARTTGDKQEYRDDNISSLYQLIHALNVKDVDVNK